MSYTALFVGFVVAQLLSVWALRISWDTALDRCLYQGIAVFLCWAFTEGFLS